MSIETELREALSARADEVPAVADPYERVTSAIAAERRRRRRAAVGGVAAVAALALAVPLVEAVDRTAPPARQSQLLPLPPASASAWDTLATWPTRGGLRGDAGLLAAAADLAGGGHVVYAEDLGPVRVLLVWGHDEGTEHGRITAVSGPRGAKAVDLRVAGAGSPAAAGVIVLREVSDPGGQLLVLAAPEVATAEVSPHVRVQPDGTVKRDWERVALRGGIGVLALRTPPPPATRVRVGAYDGAADMEVSWDGAETLDVNSPGMCLNCSGEDFRVQAEAATRYSVARTLGLLRADGTPPDDLTTHTVYSGPVDRAVADAAALSDGMLAAHGNTTVFVAVTHLPGGGVVRSVRYIVNSDSGSSASELESVVPVDAASADRLPYVLWGTAGDQKKVLAAVVAPTAAGVQLVSPAPSLWPDTAVVPVKAGTATLALDGVSDVDGFRVAAFDSSGRRLGLWPLRPAGADDPLDLVAP